MYETTRPRVRPPQAVIFFTKVCLHARVKIDYVHTYNLIIS